MDYKVEQIVYIVSTELDINIDLIFDKTRKSNIVLARHLIITYCRVYLKLTYNQIAVIFNKKSHGTIINALIQIDNYRNVNNKFNILYLDLLEKIKKN